MPAGVTTLTTPSSANPIHLNPNENRTDIDFGFNGQGSGKLGDYVWLDANNDGIQNSTETGLAGVTVTLIGAGNDGILSTADDVTLMTQTDATGHYQFTNLPASTYQVQVSGLPAGVTPTTGAQSVGSNSTTVTLGAGQSKQDVDFGFNSPNKGSIGDLVWNDQNGDGLYQVGEPLFGNVVVTLKGAGNDGILGTPDDSTQTTTTDVNGVYHFNNLPAGDYQVQVNMPAGVTTLTTPNSANPLHLNANENRTDLDFGFNGQGSGKLGDYVWLDANNNGLQDTNEQGLAGVTVTLIGAGNDGILSTADDVTLTTQTDASGHYQFTNLPASTYQVQVSGLPAGVTPTQGAQSVGSNSTTVTLAAGQSKQDVDFGFNSPNKGSIGDLVWNDQNGDGLYQVGEPVLGNIKVTLVGAGKDGVLGTSDDTTQTTTTDSNGNYLFSNLPAGSYQVQVNTPAGMNTLTTPNSAKPIQLNANENRSDLDFGFKGQGTASLGDYVWLDANQDGLQDANETPLSGVKVTLTGVGNDGVFGTADDVILSTTTDSNGHYQFTQLAASTYRVEVSNLPAGLAPTLGAQSVGNNSTVVNLSAGQSKQDVDFGYAGQGTGWIGDQVWYDTNGNGRFDAGEPVLANVGVTLISAGADGIFGTADDSLQTTRTDSNGLYRFSNLPAGIYQVAVNANELPKGVTATTFTSQPNLSFPVTLKAGEHNDSLDFGYKGTATLGDKVWFDSNEDGKLDPTEKGIPNALVQVTWFGADGKLGGGDDLVFTTHTDAQGNFLVNNLPAGDYQIAVGNLPNNVYPTHGSQSVGATSTNLSLKTGDDKRLQFGFSNDHTAQLGNKVWLDLNGNGVQDGNEVGLPNVTVQLQGAGADGIFGTADDVFSSTKTDAQGNFLFTDLAAGQYKVNLNNQDLKGLNYTTADKFSVTLSSGQDYRNADFGLRGTSSIGQLVWIDSNGDGIPDANEVGVANEPVTLIWAGLDGKLGTADDVTYSVLTDSTGHYKVTGLAAGLYQVSVPVASDAATTPTVRTFNLPANTDYPDAIFGYRYQNSIGDRIWHDVNENGVQDSDEVGIAGVSVQLRGAGADGIFGTSDDIFRSTTTGRDGYYRFSGLADGAYQISVLPSDLPAGMHFTTADSLQATVNNGQTYLDADFGLNGKGKLGTKVWLDKDQDAVIDSDEQGLPHVKVTLTWAGKDGVLGTNDDVSYSTLTNATGDYEFTGLAAGLYRVDVDKTTVPPKNTLLTTHNNLVTLSLRDQETVQNVNFGFSSVSKVTGTVWDDVDRDGIIDEGEVGIPNVQLTLITSGDDGILNTPDDLTFTTVTDSNGRYTFNRIPTGDASLTVVESTLPPSLTPTNHPGTTVFTIPGEPPVSIDLGYGPRPNSPDYTVFKTDNVRNVIPGQILTYSITVKNVGAKNGSDVSIIDTYSLNALEIVGASANGQVDASTGRITWKLAEFAAGDSQVFTVTAKVKANLSNNTLVVNNAVVTDRNGNDPTPFNNTTTDTDLVVNRTTLLSPPVSSNTPTTSTGQTPSTGTTTPPTTEITPPTTEVTPPTVQIAPPDLVLSKTDYQDTVLAGQSLTYSLTVKNDSDTAATGVVLTDHLPKGATFISASNNGQLLISEQVVSFPVFNLAEHESKTFTVSMNAPSMVLSDSLINHATVTEDGAHGNDPTPNNNTAFDTDHILAYQYNAFHNPVKPIELGRFEVIKQSLPPLPIDPIYSGAVASGTALKLTLYSQNGTEIAEQTVLADVGGNWLASFASVVMKDAPHHMEIQQVSSLYNHNVMSVYDMRTYFTPATSAQLFFSHEVSPYDVLEHSPLATLRAMHHAYNNPFAVAWDEFSAYQFFAASSTTTQHAF
jgi:uncharacterized repeat protein (TIGR01451 family)